MYHYQAFQLPIHTDLAFPELLPYSDANPSEETPLTIQFGSVSPNGIPNPTFSRVCFQANAETCWLNIPSVARFLITQGHSITIDPIANVDEDSIRVFLLGSCMGAALMQRNLFLLHGNAIKIGEHCVSFVGHSGAGKSTLSGAFLKRGYPILADDVCAISSQGTVIPSFPQIKLWLDAARHLEIETKHLRKIRPRIQKFAVPLNNNFCQERLPLKMVYILQAHNKQDIQLETLSGMHKLTPLQHHTYRKNYIKGLGKHKQYFSKCAQIASQIEIVRVTRPSDAFLLNELLDIIEQDLQTRLA